MAVDKFSGTPNFVQILNTRAALEDTLARFDEQCARQEPSTIRQRLRKRLHDIQVNINGLGKTNP